MTTRISSLLLLGLALTSCKDAQSREDVTLAAPSETQAAGELASAPPPKPAPPPEPPPAIAIDGVEVVDLHVDTPWRVHFKGRDKKLSQGHATPELVTAGRYAAIVYPIYIPDYIHDNHPTIADADAIFATIDELVQAHELFVPAVGQGKERREVAGDKVGIFVAIEGAGAFAEDITQIDRFIARGVRLVGPVHAHDNDLATSATGKSASGLSELGKKFCARVYEAGALIDVSHMSDASFEDLVPIAERYGAPIVATHSNARALAEHRRNLSDEQLKIIGQTGGVAGLNLHRSFIRRGRARMKHVVAQVKHMIEVAGVDHVAVGSDFDGGSPVAPVADASKLPELAEALQEAGLTEQDLRKVFGQNALRILYWGLPGSP